MTRQKIIAQSYFTIKKIKRGRESLKNIAFILGLLIAGLNILTTAVCFAAGVQTENEWEFQMEIYKNLLARNEKFSIIYRGNPRDVFKPDPRDIFEPVWTLHDESTTDDYDYMRFSTIRYKVEAPVPSQNTEFFFTVGYIETKEQLDYVNARIKEILPTVIGKNEYETIKKVHDFVVNYITYDETLSRHTAYQALHDKTAVCQGYALLVYKLLMSAGIPCRFIEGTARGERHAWNLVRLGEKWYYVDATLDDPISDDGESILRHDYFLVGSNKFLQDHQPESRFMGAGFNHAYDISPTDYKR